MKSGKSGVAPRLVGPVAGINAEHIGHAAAFALLALVAAVSYGNAPVLVIFGGLTLFAGVSEVLQSFLITRDTDFVDWGFNVAGIIIGIALMAALRRTGRRLLPKFGTAAGPDYENRTG